MVSKGKVKYLKWSIKFKIGLHYALRANGSVPPHMLHGMQRAEYIAYCKRNGFIP